MSKQLMQSSQQIAVNLCLQVITKSEAGAQMTTLPLLQLTPILFWLWQVRQRVNRIAVPFCFWQHWTELNYFASDLITSLEFVGKVYLIGFKALAFGMGVRL